jgi:hypothetical protein
MGDEPDTPFQGTVQLRSPNENDYSNWNIGTFWINQNFSDPLNNEIWVLVSKINNVATWIMVGTGGSTGIVFPTDGNTATPAGGELNIFGGVGVTTSGAGNTVTINTTSSILTTGTFTPVLTFGGASVGITYVTQEGMFTKIGIQCFIFIAIELSSKGSSTGDVSVTGLPFPVTLSLIEAVDIAAVAIIAVTYPAGRTEIHGAMKSGVDTIDLNATGSGVVNVRTNDTNFSNNSLIKFQGIYFTT